jgi:dTDP-4-amino-4,6-dideoxygalactose transaminase
MQKGSNQLALFGGSPARTRPMPPWPHFNEAEITSAVDVLRSGKVNYWTGSECRLFEEEFGAYIGVRHAIALANGTVALEAALWGLGIGPGDEVVVPSRTFIASASCVVMRGATPVVADVDMESQTITADTIRNALTERTRAIICVHLAGWPCDMDPILRLADEHGLKVIEDCAQCHGARYKGRMTGSLGHAAAFSFCQDKILTTCGEGGMLVTNDASVYERAWSMKDHGKNRVLAQSPAVGQEFRWLHESFGTNWRMTELQAAVGRAKLRHLDEEVATRRRNASALAERLSRLPALRVALPPAEIDHAYYKFYAFIRPQSLAPGWTREGIIAAINAEGVPCFQGSCSEIYLEEAFASHRPTSPLECARNLGETSLMFLVHPTLDVDDMRDTAAAVEKVMAVASRGEVRVILAA